MVVNRVHDGMEYLCRTYCAEELVEGVAGLQNNDRAFSVTNNYSGAF